MIWMGAEQFSDHERTIMSANQVDDILDEENDKYHTKRLSAVILLATVMLVGFIGNSLVYYIYLAKIKPTTIRCFIMALAAVDWCISVFDIPLEIFDISNRYTFGRSEGLCKVFHLLHDFLFLTTMYLLVAVAVERFRKVCQPFRKQMSILAARITIAVCSIVAFILAIPATFKYGMRTRPLRTNSSFVNGSSCSTADDHDPDLVFVNYVIWIIQDAGTFGVLAVLYCMIWCKISRHIKNRKAVAEGERQNLSNEMPLHTSESLNFQSGYQRRQESSQTISVISFNHVCDKVNPFSRQTDPKLSHFPNSYRRPIDSQQSRRESSVLSSSREKARVAPIRNMTTVMFLVALVSFLAYIPIFCKMIIRIISEEKLANFENETSGFYYIFVRTYYITCASNPLIYGFCNTAFRSEVKKVLKRMRKV